MSPGNPTRLVQLTHPAEGRRTAVVYGDELHLLATYRSIYSFAMAAIETGWTLREMLSTDLSGVVLNYQQIYALATPWRFLPAFDHPEPGRCLVSSAGAPWTYKGSGTSLYGHGSQLPVPAIGDNLQLAGELAAVYVIGPNGSPRRVGVTPGLSARASAIGPEISIDADLGCLSGSIALQCDGGKPVTRALSGGEAPLLLALAAIEPDLFESVEPSRPGDAHVHFFGARLFDARKSGSSPAVSAREGNEVTVEFDGLGNPLRCSIRAEQLAARRVAAVPL